MDHAHFDAYAFLWAGGSAVILINMLRLLAAFLLKRQGVIGSAGQVIGSLTTFSGI